MKTLRKLFTLMVNIWGDGVWGDVLWGLLAHMYVCTCMYIWYVCKCVCVGLLEYYRFPIYNIDTKRYWIRILFINEMKIHFTYHNDERESVNDNKMHILTIL